MKRPKIFFSVGEQSGDLIAAGVVRAIGSDGDCFGVCGPKMLAAGCYPVDRMEVFQAFGVSEVIQKIPAITSRFSQLVAEIERQKPDVAVLVDAPGLHFQLAERLHGIGIPVVQLVAPKLWAWGAHRVKRLKRDFAKVLGILPFEQGFFTGHGVDYTYIGCPVVDRVDSVKSKISRDHDSFSWHAALPGSRFSEWKFFLPFFSQFLQFNKDRNTRWVVPVSENLDWGDLKSYFESSLAEIKNVPCDGPKFSINDLGFLSLGTCGPVDFVKGNSLEVMARSNACLVSSGTVALEAALLGKKTVVVYKLDGLSYQVAKSLVKISYVSLPNLALDRALLDEHLQEVEVEAVSESLFSSPMDNKGYKSLVECFKPMDYAKCRNEVFELI
jgi:lipid-A-disaccharide synthase